MNKDPPLSSPSALSESLPREDALASGAMGREALEIAGGYRLSYHLRRGGLCDVVAAETEGAHRFRRPVVFKRLRPEFAGDPHWEARLRREAEILLGLSHPLCPQVHNYVELRPGVGAIVMERLDGLTLDELGWNESAGLGAFMPEARGGADDGPDGPRQRVSMPLPSREEVLRRAHELARAMVELQRIAPPGGFVHGDLHPGNLLIDARDGRLRIVDLGEARLGTGENVAQAGSPSFLAPEIVAGGTPSIHGDIYALGRMIERVAVRLGDADLADLGAWLADPDLLRRPADWSAVVEAIAESLEADERGLLGNTHQHSTSPSLGGRIAPGTFTEARNRGQEPPPALGRLRPLGLRLRDFGLGMMLWGGARRDMAIGLLAVGSVALLGAMAWWNPLDPARFFRGLQGATEAPIHTTPYPASVAGDWAWPWPAASTWEGARAMGEGEEDAWLLLAPHGEVWVDGRRRVADAAGRVLLPPGGPYQLELAPVKNFDSNIQYKNQNRSKWTVYLYPQQTLDLQSWIRHIAPKKQEKEVPVVENEKANP